MDSDGNPDSFAHAHTAVDPAPGLCASGWARKHLCADIDIYPVAYCNSHTNA